VHEQVRVVGRLADQRQHASIFYIDRHHRPAPAVERGDRGHLHVDVERGAQVLPRGGRLALEHAQLAALGVDLHFLQSDPSTRSSRPWALTSTSCSPTSPCSWAS
jgi:hypothetical protein